MTVSFVVHGTPAPGGSKRGFYNAKLGRVIITDANPKARPWKALVADAASEAMAFEGDDGTNGYRPLLEGPLLVELTFWMPRPKHHFGSGRNAGVLKATAPAFHTSAPDALKLARGTEDALQGLVYRNDSQIAEEHLRKLYGEPARCEIRIAVLDADAADFQHQGLHEATESATPAQLLIEPALEKEVA